MGVGTDAIMFYGYVFENENEGPFSHLCDEDEDCLSSWVDRLAMARGAEDQSNGDEIRGAIKREFDVEIGYHCSAESLMCYVAIESSKMIARRGFPTRIEWVHHRIDPSWDDKLDRWIRETGAKMPERQRSGWWLVSWCG